MKNKTISLAFAAISIFSSACSTVGYQKADNTSSTLQETAKSIDRSIPPLDATLVALNNLLNSPSEEFKPRFEAYQTSVSEFETSMNEVNKDNQTMQTSGKAYFSNWSQELSKIQNDSIELRSRERMEDLTKRFEKTNDQYAQSTAESSPFLSNLNDIRTALATDLTDGGIDSLKGLQKQLDRDGKALRETLIELSTDCKSLAIDLSTSPTS